jgi:hypothetical protein
MAGAAGIGRPRCIVDRGRFLDAIGWYAVCFGGGMLSMLTAPDLTLVLLLIIVSLGTAFVWMLWEIERMSRQQATKQRRKLDGFG